jgi:hypothetical protein
MHPDARYEYAAQCECLSSNCLRSSPLGGMCGVLAPRAGALGTQAFCSQKQGLAVVWPARSKAARSTGVPQHPAPCRRICSARPAARAGPRWWCAACQSPCTGVYKQQPANHDSADTSRPSRAGRSQQAAGMPRVPALQRWPHCVKSSIQAINQLPLLRHKLLQNPHITGQPVHSQARPHQIRRTMAGARVLTGGWTRMG